MILCPLVDQVDPKNVAFGVFTEKIAGKWVAYRKPIGSNSIPAILLSEIRPSIAVKNQKLNLRLEIQPYSYNGQPVFGGDSGCVFYSVSEGWIFFDHLREPLYVTHADGSVSGDGFWVIGGGRDPKSAGVMFPVSAEFNSNYLPNSEILATAKHTGGAANKSNETCNITWDDDWTGNYAVEAAGSNGRYVRRSRLDPTGYYVGQKESKKTNVELGRPNFEVVIDADLAKSTDIFAITAKEYYLRDGLSTNDSGELVTRSGVPNTIALSAGGAYTTWTLEKIRGKSVSDVKFDQILKGVGMTMKGEVINDGGLVGAPGSLGDFSLELDRIEEVEKEEEEDSDTTKDDDSEPDRVVFFKVSKVVCDKVITAKTYELVAFDDESGQLVSEDGVPSIIRIADEKAECDWSTDRITGESTAKVGYQTIAKRKTRPNKITFTGKVTNEGYPENLPGTAGNFTLVYSSLVPAGTIESMVVGDVSTWR